MNEPLLEAARVPLNLQGREARRRLARLALALFARWDLSTAEQAALLGLSPDNRATIARYRRGEPLGESRDLVERVGHLLGIHKSLRILFPHDRDLAYRWLKTPNRRLGAPPLEIMIGRGFEGLLAVRRYLDFERGR